MIESSEVMVWRKGDILIVSISKRLAKAWTSLVC